MRASLKYKFIFLSNPRCASRSIRKMLDEHSEIKSVHISERTASQTFYHHIRAQEAKEHFEARGLRWDDFFSFCVVRNPWTRVPSLFSWYKYHNPLSEICLEEFVFNVIDVQRPMMMSALNFAQDSNRRVLINRFLKFEALESESAALAEHLALGHIKLANVGRGNTAPAEDMGKAVTDKIAELYSDDVEYFCYSPPGS